MKDKYKKRISKLLKTHISYLSIIILVIGLNFKYSLPSFFPLLNKIDIKYFGNILVQFGLIFFIGNLLIDRYKEEVNKNLFSEILDSRIGYRGLSLLTEVVNLVNPFSYNLILYETNCHIKKSSNHNSKKYDMVQKFKVKINPLQDNVHYRFGVASTGEEEKPKINYVKLNGKKLILSKEIRKEESASLSGHSGISYEILIPLKIGKKYEIEIETIYPSCMSDLNDNEEYDYQEYEYRALTEKTIITSKYDFPNFEEYEFRAERRYLNIPDITRIDCRVNKKEKEVIIEAGNLKNGDKICLIYVKRKPNSPQSS